MVAEPLDIDFYRPNLILVGYADETSRAVLERAAQLAKSVEARLLIAHVAPPLDQVGLTPVPMSAFPPEAPIAAPFAPLADTETPSPEEPAPVADVHELLSSAEIDYEVIAVTGEPAERIVDLASERDAKLIVVGSEERGFLDRLLGGSVTTEIARHAPCDVMVVQPAGENSK